MVVKKTDAEIIPQIEPIELSKIRVSDLNVRKKGIKEEEIDELADSIKAVGLINPVEVIIRKGRDKLDLIVGQRRYLAHKKLGRKTIRAIVLDALDDRDAVIRSLVENVHRATLNHADAARATTELYKHFKKDAKKVHRVTGLSYRRIRQYVEIEEQASARTKRKLREKRVEPVDVQRVIRAAQGDIEKADEMLDMMKQYQLDPHQKGRLVEYGEDHPKWTASRIVEEALKPRVEKKVIVALSPKIREGLQNAVDELDMAPDEITADALERWLEENGYL